MLIYSIYKEWLTLLSHVSPSFRGCRNVTNRQTFESICSTGRLVLVGVKLEGELTIRLLHVLIGRGLRHTQYLIVVLTALNPDVVVIAVVRVGLQVVVRYRLTVPYRYPRYFII